jgi:Icc-related predicted phosphoesterase
MKIDYISDLHLDFYVREKNPTSYKLAKQVDEFIEMIRPNKHDVLIIAGDLGHYYHQDTLLLQKLKLFYKHILLVAGNHDMYLVSNNIQKSYEWDSWNRIQEMKVFCDSIEGLEYLDGNAIEIEGVTFAGCGMGWDMSYAKTIRPGIHKDEVKDHWIKTMNDANLMFMDGKDKYTVPLGYGYHKIPSFRPFEFFESELNKLNKIESADVMITHYGPKIPDKMHSQYVDDLTTTFYYFDGSEAIERLKPKYWVYGHTHKSYTDVMGETTIINNPLGYPSENSYATIQTIEVNK